MLNLADEPSHRYLARVVATVAVELPHQLLIATHDVLKRRRFGNLVLVASRKPLPEDEVARRLARASFPAGIRRERDLSTLVRSVAGWMTQECQPSPAPPDPGRWRVS